MIPNNYDLDVDTPEKFPVVLECVANHYRESASDLSAAWQDREAGKIWADFATILDRAAASARRALTKRGF